MLVVIYVQIPQLQLRLSTVWHMISGVTICAMVLYVVANIVLECSRHDRLYPIVRWENEKMGAC